MAVEYQKTGSGPLLLYICGLDGTGQLFFRQADQLQSQFTVVTFTLRHEGKFDYQKLTEDVLEVLEKEHADHATIVAESFGGTIALNFAIQHPERIDRLILVNTFPYFRKRFRLALGRTLLPLAFLPVVRWGRNLIAKPLLSNELVDQKGIEKLLECSWSHDLQTYRQRMKMIAEVDLRNQLHQIQCPVVIVASTRDKIVPSVREAKFMAAEIPNAKVHILQRHGHACLLSPSFSLSEVLCNEEH